MSPLRKDETSCRSLNSTVFPSLSRRYSTSSIPEARHHSILQIVHVLHPNLYRFQIEHYATTKRTQPSCDDQTSFGDHDSSHNSREATLIINMPSQLRFALSPMLSSVSHFSTDISDSHADFVYHPLHRPFRIKFDMEITSDIDTKPVIRNPLR